MKLPHQIAPAALISAMRASVYGGLAAWLGISDTEAREILDAAVVGAVSADFITWLAMTLLSLPGHLARGCCEGLVNLLLVLCLLQFGFAGSLPRLDGQALAVAFLVFMLVVGIKAAWYAAVYLVQIDEG